MHRYDDRSKNNANAIKGFALVACLLGTVAIGPISGDVESTPNPVAECSDGSDCTKVNDTARFTPPPADAMSRLMPTSQAVLSNDTKDPSASNIDIVTTPDTGSLGLGSFSSFAKPTDQQGFNPSPFLGVISEAHIHSYPQGVAVGEVFPDSVGDRHLGGHKYIYSIAGQRAPHTGHSYHDQVTLQRPTSQTIVDSADGFQSTQGIPDRHISYPPTQEALRPTVETGIVKVTYAPRNNKDSPLTSSTKSLGYPTFEIPDRFKDFKDVSNSITDYKLPAPVAFPSLEKPIKEDYFDERPDAFPTGAGGGLINGPDAFAGPATGPDAYGGPNPPPLGGLGPGLPPPPAFTSPPAFYNKPPPGLYKGGKGWKGLFKVMASLIPLGLLVAAFTPNLLVVNATEDPAALVEAPSQTQTQSQPQIQSQPQFQPQLPVGQTQSSFSSAEWTKVPTRNPSPTAKTSYRSLESIENPPEIPSGLPMTQCQKKKVCEALLGVDDSYKWFIDSLVSRIGGSMNEIVDLAKAKKCIDIPCIT